MIEIIIFIISIIASVVFGINYGKLSKENEQKEKQVNNVKKATTIDNTVDDDIISMYDKYE